ncbi:hypothetical protein QR680_012374 [Steinernema hermaphroditum]|uniref:Uncharacterized protein n=1 Tax=Steinernema hermaphroditum TaxID=289476 RepID=A0AA39I4D2_9BILA|nr:hypothetical protein QR680_012374 [Steinernema hermaphroditum]
MNAKVVFVVVLCAALLATAFVDAKKAKQDKKGKGKAEAKGKVEKVKVQKREVKAPKEKVVEKVVEVQKPVEEKPAVPVEEELVEEEPVAPVAAEAEPERPRVVKPKHLKIMSAYEECKLQCKKQRDQEDAQQYVARLREELTQAEALIVAQEAATQEVEAAEATETVEETVPAAKSTVQ